MESKFAFNGHSMNTLWSVYESGLPQLPVNELMSTVTKHAPAERGREREREIERERERVRERESDEGATRREREREIERERALRER